jgi:hypothetical protein
MQPPGDSRVRRPTILLELGDYFRIYCVNIMTFVPPPQNIVAPFHYTGSYFVKGELSCELPVPARGRTRCQEQHVTPRMGPGGIHHERPTVRNGGEAGEEGHGVGPAPNDDPSFVPRGPWWCRPPAEGSGRGAEGNQGGTHVAWKLSGLAAPGTSRGLDSFVVPEEVVRSIPCR